MQEMSKFSGAGLPSQTDVQNLAQALADVAKEFDNGSFLKLDSGRWVYGQDEIEVEKGSVWAVNPFSFTKGYIAWGENGGVIEQRIAPLSNQISLGDLDVAPAGSKGWDPCLGVSLKCWSGQDKGEEVTISFSTKGGRRALSRLSALVSDHIISNDATTPIALINLNIEGYVHKMYGKKYNPIFTIVDWVSMDAEPNDAYEEEDVIEEKPLRRQRVTA